MKKNPKSLIVNRKSQNLKDFVNNFNFPNPDWDKLPVGFPNMVRDGLTREENHLLDAIKLAWFVSVGWKKSAVKSVKTGFITILIIFGLIGFVSLLNRESLAQPVEAASLTVNAVIDSTMSAILKK